MFQIRLFRAFGLTAIALISSVTLAAQGDLTAIQQAVSSQFRLTRTTADNTDIVTAGDVVTIHKSNLVMFSGTAVPATNSYRKGGIGQGFGTVLIESNPNTIQRTFVSQEKCWVTAITVQKDGVSFGLFSDPYNGNRYFGVLKIEFPVKKEIPPVDVVLKVIAEVLTVDGQNDQPEPAQPGRMGPAPEAVPAPASMPAIAPPPTIDLGQTKDMVIATCGQPLRIARLGEKEIFYYKDMKVTFINGAVSNVE